MSKTIEKPIFFFERHFEPSNWYLSKHEVHLMGDSEQVAQKASYEHA